jgi:hypothetical protein
MVNAKLSQLEIKKRAKARKVSIAEGSAYSVMDGFGLRNITSYAVALNSSNFVIGMLNSVPSLIGNIAQIFTILFKIPITESSIKRRIDEIGRNLPSEEEISEKMTERKMPKECHIDGYYPLGTDNCVMVIKDEYDRILITHETGTENAAEAGKFLRKLKNAGTDITSAFSDYSGSLIRAIKEVFPKVKFQADHFHTMKTIWGHLKKALSLYRKDSKLTCKETDDMELSETASKLWELRWSLLKKPSNLSEEEEKKIEDLEKTDSGFISEFRSVIRHIVNISDYSNTEVQAEIKLKKLKKLICPIENTYLNKISRFFDEHWQEAMQFLRKRGLAKHRRSSNSESGMRILRRLEKNHDGIRSEVTRKNYIKIYQIIKYLSIDITDFLNNTIQSDNCHPVKILCVKGGTHPRIFTCQY